MDLAKFIVRPLRRPKCPDGRRFGAVHSDHQLSGAFVCVSPETVAPGGDCQIKVVAFQRDPRCDSVAVVVKLHGSDRLFWPDRRNAADVTRSREFDLAETTDDLKAAKSFGLGSWGAFSTVRMIARNRKAFAAVRDSRIGVDVNIGGEQLPEIHARVELAE